MELKKMNQGTLEKLGYERKLYGYKKPLYRSGTDVVEMVVTSNRLYANYKSKNNTRTRILMEYEEALEYDSVLFPIAENPKKKLSEEYEFLLQEKAIELP